MKKGNSNGTGIDIAATLTAGEYVIVLDNVKLAPPTATSTNKLPMATIKVAPKADYDEFVKKGKKEDFDKYQPATVGGRGLLLPLGLGAAEDQKSAIKARTEFFVGLAFEDASFEDEEGKVTEYQRKIWTKI